MENNKHWWEDYPWRMIQTNLRETDMEDICAEEYANELAEFGATVVTLNAAGIIASYDTKLPFHTKSSYLHGSNLHEIIDACHKRGIRVIGRMDFSKIRYPLFEKHQDWAYRDKNGDILNYNGDVQTCPNGGYQKEAMFDILKEVLSEFPFDGVFCNMSGFLVVDYSGVYHGPCHCENCRKLFKEQYGEDIPAVDNFKDPAYRKYAEFKSKCIKLQKAKMCEVVRGISPEIAINGVDYMRTESNTDIGRPSWIYSASSNARLSSGMDKVRPADNACVDFIGFRYRDISVSPSLVALRHWQSLANSGCLSLYIMGRLDNHRDISSYEPTIKAFQLHKAHEELFAHMKSAAKTVLVRSNMTSRDDPEGYGWVKVLTESHIPFDEIKASELTDVKILNGKELLILGALPSASPKLLSIADEFARNGGKVISCGETGFANGKCVLECMGIREIISVDRNCMSSMFEIQDSEKEIFPECKKAPYIMPGSEVIHFSCCSEAEQHMHFIPEHPFGPPERCYFTETTEEPGLTVIHYGKGLGIYIPFKPASMLWQEGYQNTMNFLRDVLFSIAGSKSIASKLSEMVETTINESEGKTIVQLVNTSGAFGKSFVDPLPIYNISLSLAPSHIKQVQSLNGGKVDWEMTENGLEIRLNTLIDYEAIIIEK